jgi:hypothetical protein
MIHTMLFVPHDRRSTLYFWVGIAILPIFWAWFTLSKSFAPWQRCIAVVCAAAQAFLIWETFPQMTDRYSAIAFAFPAFSIYLTLGLFTWLFMKVTKFTLIELFAGFMVFGMHIDYFLHFTIDRWIAAGVPWPVSFLPLVPILLVLALDPEHRVFRQVTLMARRR